MNPLFEHPYVVNMQNVFLLGFLATSTMLFFLNKKKSPHLLAALPIFIVTFHQVDEYLISPFLFGDEYHFLNWAYRSGVDVTPMAVVVINLIGYLIALLPFLLKQSNKFFHWLIFLLQAACLATACFTLEAQLYKVITAQA
jgi:hypothetical protein